MAKAHTPVLYYCYDPMCSYCYAFRKNWQRLQQTLPPNIKIVKLLGGLAPDSDEPMADAMRNKLINTWHSINKRFGVEFNFEFWDKNIPRRSTYPACRAVLVAKNYQKEDQMTKEIQNAYYRQAKNPSDLEILGACAKAIGIGINDFLNQIQSEKINKALMSDIAQARKLGLNSFPSLLFTVGKNHSKIPINYINHQPMLDTIKLLVNSS